MVKGKQAVLYRGRLLSEFLWTPLREVPVYDNKIGKTFLPAGVPVKGMLYSSTEPTDKFVCENLSFETFRTIVKNPHSALYTKDLAGHNNSWAYFGLVCNGFVRYSLNIPRRYSTKRWLSVPGMRLIARAGQYSARDMELCDVLYVFGSGRNHVAMITDLQKDEQGNVIAIEISEAIRPSCSRKLFSVAEFFEKFPYYALCRYDYVDEVPMPEEQDVAFFEENSVSAPKVSVDYGNKANYRTCEAVVICTFCAGQLQIFRNGEVLEQLEVSEPIQLTRRFPRGYYQAKLAGETVEFCVTEPEISHEVKDGMVYIQASSCDPESQIQHLEFREASGKPKKAAFYSDHCAALVSVEELTEEEKRTGKIVRPIPEEGENFKVYFKNKYGVWTHTMMKL